MNIRVVEPVSLAPALAERDVIRKDQGQALIPQCNCGMQGLGLWPVYHPYRYTTGSTPVIYRLYSSNIQALPR